MKYLLWIKKENDIIELHSKHKNIKSVERVASVLEGNTIIEEFKKMPRIKIGQLK